MVRHGPERQQRNTPARRGWSLRHYMALFMALLLAADAETAERLMARKTARAVVLDLLPPGIQGEAFLQRLRVTRGPGIPVVVLTQKELDAAERLSLQKAGVTAVFRKAANLIAKSLTSELVAS